MSSCYLTAGSGTSCALTAGSRVASELAVFRSQPERAQTTLSLRATCRSLDASREAHDTALRNAASHADPHSHGCPSAPAMQHSGGADVTVALRR
jgi:hypothetical protein